MPEETGRLKLEAPRSGTVAETSEYLDALDMCYRHLCAFHDWVDEMEHGEWRRRSPFPQYWYPVPSLDVLTLIDTPLRITAVQLQSPGFWEFLGLLKALETIRKYLADRYEQWKDREWRKPHEAEKLRLENERLRTQVVSERVKLLRDLGVPQSVIRRAFLAHVAQPLATLDRFQDLGLIGDVLSDSQQVPPPPKRGRPSRRIRLPDDDEPKDG